MPSLHSYNFCKKYLLCLVLLYELSGQLHVCVSCVFVCMYVLKSSKVEHLIMIMVHIFIAGIFTEE